MMNIAVLQFYTSNINYGVYSEMINQKYCEDKGYTYVCEKNTERIISICDERSFHWGKVKLVQELLDTDKFGLNTLSYELISTEEIKTGVYKHQIKI